MLVSHNIMTQVYKNVSLFSCALYSDESSKMGCSIAFSKSNINQLKHFKLFLKLSEMFQAWTFKILVVIATEANIQGDQIGQNFAIWVIFYGVGQIFF